MRSKVIPGIDGLALKVMINKLSRAILEYSAGAPDAIDWAKEIQESFECALVRLLKDHGIKENEVELQYSDFKRKAFSNLKKVYKPYSIKSLKNKQMRFSLLIMPLCAILEKYLTDQKKRKLRTNQTDIYHYIAHLLIACGIEERDKGRGHWPVFEKIKQHAYRSGFAKYMGHARPS